MTLSEQDRANINDLINLHGHLTDAGQLDQAGELFTPDVTYDLGDFGGGSLHGTAEMRAAALALGNANPVGHHVTNIMITRIDDRSARVQSKGIGIKADGTAGSVVYDDIVTRQPDGWKISQRKVTARRAALGAGKKLTSWPPQPPWDAICDAQVPLLAGVAGAVGSAAPHPLGPPGPGVVQGPPDA
jgi:hypothetical protein